MGLQRIIIIIIIKMMIIILIIISSFDAFVGLTGHKMWKHAGLEKVNRVTNMIESNRAQQKFVEIITDIDPSRFDKIP